jgi:hypothetical protein
MPKAGYKWCKGCGKHTNEVGPLSHTRLCVPCGKARLAAAIVEQKQHRGPTFQHWRRQIAASVGAVVLDSDRADE